ncbi:hypothetical protein WIS52_07800 [Pseudonocardia nematodicida]|uniref:Molecular chaperone Hsp90 n=1 Tax=Pseudonocardia nematodicida TaxID=1206997 RepID=A0ABV1K7A7_9PSEU
MRCAFVGDRGGRIPGVRLGAGLRRRRGPRAGRFVVLSDPSGDLFGTAALRDGVLAAWAASPTRFREDVNTEDDLRRGGYADTWVAELLQNAADAAVEAGVPGRVRASVHDGELRIANTGVPLTAAGVAALAALRASAKRDVHGATGRFGVGFAAVLAVCSAPRLVSAAGGVAFSASRTASEVAALDGAAAAELARDARVPALRLVWPAEDPDGPPEGYATEVRLPPDAGDPAVLLDEFARTAADLLLALPALERVEAGDAVLTRDEPAPGRVRVSGPTGPREFRTGIRGEVRWVLPLASGEPAPLGPDAGEVLHAPTPSLEALSLPARLFAPFPLDPDRRRIRAEDPAADGLVADAAVAYADLVRSLAPEHRTSLVPAPAFPRSPLDARLREAIAAELARTPWLPAARAGRPPAVPRTDPSSESSSPAGGSWEVPAGGPGPGDDAAVPRTDPSSEFSSRGVRSWEVPAGGPGPSDADAVLAPDRAEWLDLGVDTPGLPELLAAADPAFERLIASGVTPPPGLDVDRLGPAGLAERLTGVDTDPAWWGRLYAALAPAVGTVPGLAAELGALPVPLADGRLVPGPASVLVASGGTAPAIPELRIVHPDAAHPLLHRLGAADADRETLLAAPALHEAVARSLDDAEAGLDTAPLAHAVLKLLDTPSAERDDRFGALALTDADGAPARADELVLPDAAVRDLLDPDVPVGVLAEEWLSAGRDALVAAGVLDRFAVVAFDPEVLHEAEAYLSSSSPDVDDLADALPAVRDLDLVADDAWPAALALLAGDRDTRAAMLTGHTAWWLARHVRLGGRLPSTWRLGSATDLAGLYDAVPETGVDEAVLAAIGVRTGPSVTCADDAAALLDRLAEADRPVSGAVAAAAHSALAAAVADGVVDLDDLDPPEQVRTVDGAVAPAEEAVVLDAPWVLPALDDIPAVPGGDDPETLAELLDLPLASDRVTGTVRGTGRPVEWASIPEAVLAARAVGADLPSDGPVLHDELVVDLDRGGRVAVPVWPGDDGRWHATDPVRALVAALGAQRRVRMIP